MLSVFLFDGERGVLNPPLPRQGLVLGLLLLRLSDVIRKEIELNGVVALLRRVRLPQNAVGHDVHAADQQIFVHNPVKQLRHRAHDPARGGGVAVKVDRAVRLLGHLPPIGVGFNPAAILRPPRRIGQVFNVIADGQHHLVGDKPLVHQIQHEQIRHLADDEPRLLRLVRAMQHLSGADAVRARPIRLDRLDGRRLPAPCVVDEQLRVFAEQPVEQILAALRAEGDVAHRHHPVLLQLFGDAPPHAPKIRDGLMRPELAAEFHFVQLRDADAVLIGGHVLGHNVHRHLAQKQVCADSRGGRDAGRLQHVEDDLHGEIVRRKPVCAQVIRRIHEHLVDGIDHDILRRDVFEVNLIDSAAVRHVIRHSRRRDDEIHRQRRIGLQL